MAATAFTLYNSAKKYFMNGTLALGTTALRLRLHQSTSNASTFTLSTYASVTVECSARSRYLAGGLPLATVSVKSIASAKSISLDAADWVVTASASAINNVCFAVIGGSGSTGKLLCWSKLSTANFTITVPNTLTISFAANGIFEIH
jgi:hypothetical protein